ncbi:uncharacterized protein A4U43_C06F13020 [Asparagus officinalis]|uniref:Uncharacterized protein n=1 Tax=Asparagus officinalis TaxID=4686 RepID=A0A5P1EQN5_ASPOF|nr:uncharacterized protein A4U43_C06F13020 [Asparagus officinalis]
MGGSPLSRHRRRPELGGSGIVTRRPLVLQLHKTEDWQPEYAEFLHMPRRKFTDFCELLCYQNDLSRGDISFWALIYLLSRYDIKQNNVILAEDKHVPMIKEEET